MHHYTGHRIHLQIYAILVVICDSMLWIHPSFVYYLKIEPCLYLDNKQSEYKRHTDNVSLFYKIPACPGEDIILTCLTFDVCCLQVCWIRFMYFMSQNWPITHCLESWCGLELTGEKISQWAPWHAEHHAGFLQSQEVLEKISHSLGGWRKNEDSEMLALCWGGGGGVTVDRRKIWTMLLKCWLTDWSRLQTANQQENKIGLVYMSHCECCSASKTVMLCQVNGSGVCCNRNIMVQSSKITHLL